MGEDRGRLLVVDDDEPNRDMLSRRLARRGHDVEVAADGRRAIEMIEESAFDLVLLDVMMPGLSGLEVLEIVRRSHEAVDLPVIMATAKTRSDDIVEALRLGANDYVTKPLDFPVLLARVQTHLAHKRTVDRVRDLERNLADRNRTLEAANLRMTRDLRAAARVQAALLPRDLPDAPGYGFGWTFRPCDELAGDGLGIVRLDATRVGLYILDVSGHGVASSLLSVSVAHAMTHPADPSSVLYHPGPDGGPGRPATPSEVADRLGRLFPFDETTEQYFTLLYGILDVGTGEFRYLSAGHPAPILVPAAGGPVILEGRGFPIGLIAGPPEEHRAVLNPGDRLYLYSDGVTEAMTPGRELFGEGRLSAAAGRLRDVPPGEAVAAIRAEVEAWSAEAGLRDDVSVLAIDVAPSPH